MTYKETIEHLFNSAPLFQNVGKSAYKEGLETTLALDAHFGHPHRKFKSIHVGGTNGKGSVSHTLASILQHSGYKVGLYTSPHLIDFRERIRVNGIMIPEQRVIDFVTKERTFYEPLHPSFFELTTALAFLYFAEQEVDVVVVEVGLGGRLDCTNIINPDLSIITNISFDHTQFLGTTLSQIATEKAGIIKAGVPVVIGESGNSGDGVKEVFLCKANEMNSLIRFANEEDQVISCTKDLNENPIYNTRDWGVIEAELGGLCQDKNTRTILCAVDKLCKSGYKISTESLRCGFKNVCKTTGLMGRWQILEHKPLVVCDTGHNIAGIQYIVEHLSTLKCQRLHMIVGMVNDKDIRGVLQLLPKNNTTYYFTKASVQRALPENQLAELANEVGINGNVFPDVKSAFLAAKEVATADDVVFVGGSTFIVADLLSYIFC